MFDKTNKKSCNSKLIATMSSFDCELSKGKHITIRDCLRITFLQPSSLTGVSKKCHHRLQERGSKDIFPVSPSLDVLMFTNVLDCNISFT